MINTNFINGCIKRGEYNMVNITEKDTCFVCTLEVKKPDPKNEEDDGQMSLPGMDETEKNPAAQTAGEDGGEDK
jgi:hypothetical protein